MRALAGRAPISVTVITVDDTDRWHPLVESAAYFVVAESLTNTLEVRAGDLCDRPHRPS